MSQYTNPPTTIHTHTVCTCSASKKGTSGSDKFEPNVVSNEWSIWFKFVFYHHDQCHLHRIPFHYHRLKSHNLCWGRPIPLLFEEFRTFLQHTKQKWEYFGYQFAWFELIWKTDCTTNQFFCYSKINWWNDCYCFAAHRHHCNAVLNTHISSMLPSLSLTQNQLKLISVNFFAFLSFCYRCNLPPPSINME